MYKKATDAFIAITMESFGVVPLAINFRGQADPLMVGQLLSVLGSKEEAAGPTLLFPDK